MTVPVYSAQCPVCGHHEIRELFPVKDYTVSGENFLLAECGCCSLRFTRNVPDAASIGPYYASENYISHSNTSKGLIHFLYQQVRKITLKGKRKLLQRVTGLRTGALLDVGAGTGAFLKEMAVNGWQVTGLEPDEGARRMARDINGLSLLPAESLYQLPPASFDAITLWHVLEHVHTLHDYMDRLRVLLKPGGKLLVAVPNYTSLDAEYYGPHWAAYDVPRHLYHFSPKSLRVLAERHGLNVKSMRPMWFDSFYVSLLSTRYRWGKTRYVQAFFSGLRSNFRAWKDTTKASSVIYLLEA